MTDPNARHIAALWYAKAFGWKVFPVGAKSKKPMAGGLLSASDDATQVEQWFTRHPRANVGINLGASGLLVLDVDSKDGGDESFDDLMKAIELEELATPRAITGDGGSHYYLKRPTGGFRRDEISQAFKDQYPGISVLCDGDYVVAPPSIHPNGKTYEWADSAQPQNVKPTQAPTALIELATEGTKAMTAPGPPRLSLVQGTPSTDGTAAIEQAPAIQPYARTDLGNTERLVDWFGDDFRYCPALQKYLIWRNGRWKVDDEGVIYLFAQRTVRKIVTDEAPALPNSKDQTQLVNFATRSESRSRLEAMTWGARHQERVVVSHERLDQRSTFLTARNGTIDLHTGGLMPHQRDDLITRFCPVTYDPKAEAPLFEAFLDTTFQGDRELIEFVQRALGYSMTGSTEERVFFIAYGGGKNGKSTLLNLIAQVLGDYATNTPTETLMEKRFDGGPSNDIARLRGVRLVTAFEGSEGKRLAESMIKQLTGGDPITARFLHAEFFCYEPQFTIWLSTNHKPIIHGTDDAIWDRVRLIPFLNRIPAEAQDGKLRDKLAAERQGVLAWLVRGAVAWAQNGLGTNDKVSAMTASYREAQDQLGRFIEESCQTIDGVSIKSSELFTAYRDWCERNGERPVGQAKFGERLSMKGFTPGKGSKGVRIWYGLTLDSGSAVEPGDTYEPQSGLPL